MSTARKLATATPGEALGQLNSAHARVIAARMRAGLAVERYDREFAASVARVDFLVTEACLNESETAQAELAAAEQGIRAAFLGYGLAVGIVEDAGTI